MKRTKDLYGKHWSPLHLLSFHKPLMISLGVRGIGKSTGTALFCIYQYYNKGELFIYTRRNVDELKQTQKDYFFGALEIYNEFYGTNHAWELKDGAYIDENKHTVGFAVPLSQADKFKSAAFGAMGVRTIIYDEFVLAKGKETAYLGSKSTPYLEYDLLIRLYQTVDRKPGYSFLNETRIFCLGNFANLYNPILLGCGADKYMTIESKCVSPKSEPWVVELTSEVEATKEIKTSNGYKLARKEIAEGDYNNNGYITADNIRKLKGVMNPLINVDYMGRKYGIYLYEKGGVVYVTEKQSQSAQTIALTMDDGRINRVTAVKWNSSASMAMLRRFVEMGLCVFQTARARTDILTYLNFTV